MQRRDNRSRGEGIAEMTGKKGQEHAATDAEVRAQILRKIKEALPRMKDADGGEKPPAQGAIGRRQKADGQGKACAGR